MFTALALLTFTFVSEDLACVAAGALIARGDLAAWAGITACAAGIFLGDCGLWAAGRFGSTMATASPRVASWLNGARAERYRLWLEQHAGQTILASRFTPGARLPVYLAAGMLRLSPARFAAWTLVAAISWTPVVVLASARSASAVSAGHTNLLWPLATAWIAVTVVARSARLLAAPSSRSRAMLALDRWRRWEFWPPWLFYAPVAAWIAVLAIRHRSLTVFTASNPGMPDGGFVGESKYDILKQLPPDCIIPSIRVEGDSPSSDHRSGNVDERCSRAATQIAAAGWAFPLVVKPDVGQRGVGVRKVASPVELEAYLTAVSGDVLVQPYHPGPYEAGIFYYRRPNEPRGRIFSITDKHFPVIVGDGASTVGELIVAHPRYRLQSALFLARHHACRDAILSAGDSLSLALAGNHAQGTTFKDGAHLLTPALEARVEAIAQTIPGFFIGRFDVRYSGPEAFAQGHDLAIVELNGAAAESTNIYDPDASVWSAYRVLFTQWSLVFEIGAANRARGAMPTTIARLMRLVASHLTATPIHPPTP